MKKTRYWSTISNPGRDYAGKYVQVSRHSITSGRASYYVIYAFPRGVGRDSRLLGRRRDRDDAIALAKEYAMRNDYPRIVVSGSHHLRLVERRR